MSRAALAPIAIALSLAPFAACKKAASDAAAPAGSSAPMGGGRGARGGRGAGLTYAVDVLNVEAKKVDYDVKAPCTLQAFERVQVTARVAGVVDKVAFAEGQDVKKGDPLVIIDAERFRLAVNSAKAALDKAEAAQADAEAMVKRREGASEAHPGLIPGEELATYQTKVLTAKADSAVAREALRTAQVNLRDASVRAPMSGVIQTRTVETGQYVQAGYVMATLLRTTPMLVTMNVLPEDAPRIKPGQIFSFTMRESLRTYTAKVTLVSAAADETTHMVGITGEVVDTEHKFWLRPGSFCDADMKIGASREAPIVPRLAVRPSERGFIAYVVENGVAHERVLTLGMTTENGWIEVRSGLSAGDQLVVRGAEPLSEGAKVRPNVVTEESLNQSAAAAAASASANAPGPPPPRPWGSAAPAGSASSAAAPASSGRRGRRQ